MVKNSYTSAISKGALLILFIDNAYGGELTAIDAGINSLGGGVIIGLIYFWYRRKDKDYASESKGQSALAALKISLIYPAFMVVAYATSALFSQADSPQKLQQIEAQRQAETLRKQIEVEALLKSDAKWACKLYIEKSLKAPSTANFQNYTQFTAVGKGDGPYLVRGYVDAQNSFGAMIRSDFSCLLHKVKDDWILDEMNMN